MKQNELETAFQLGLLELEKRAFPSKAKRKPALKKPLHTLGSAIDLITWVTDGAYTHKEMFLLCLPII
jgi:hypothetical protein